MVNVIYFQNEIDNVTLAMTIDDEFQCEHEDERLMNDSVVGLFFSSSLTHIIIYSQLFSNTYLYSVDF